MRAINISGVPMPEVKVDSTELALLEQVKAKWSVVPISISFLSVRTPPTA